MGRQDGRWQDFTSPGTGMRRKMKLDPVTSDLVVCSEQENMSELLQLNQAFLNADRNTSSLWGGRSMVRVASIPLELVEEWRKKGLDLLKQDPDVIAKCLSMLSSNEYEKLRTAPGRLA